MYRKTELAFRNSCLVELVCSDCSVVVVCEMQHTQHVITGVSSQPIRDHTLYRSGFCAQYILRFGTLLYPVIKMIPIVAHTVSKLTLSPFLGWFVCWAYFLDSNTVMNEFVT